MKKLTVLGAMFVFLLLLQAVAVAEEYSFDSDGVQIHYRTDGQGEPVVLIHGFTASAQTNWVSPGIYDALSKEYRVIALDVRGHGKSGKPHGRENYGPKMAKDVINLLDELDIQKAHIVGYSMGGFITTNIVCNYPDRVISAVSGGAGWTPPGAFEDSGTNAIAESLENGQGLAPLFELLTPEGQPAPSAEQLEMINRMLMSTNDPLALAGAARGIPDLTVTETQLKANTVPVRAVVGEIDPLKAGVDEMAKVMSNLHVVVLEGADHMTAFGKPAFVQAILEHLRANGLDKRTDAEAESHVAAAGANR